MNYIKILCAAICVMACGSLLSGCDKSDHHYSCQDMFAFYPDEFMEGYIECVTRLDAVPDSRLQLVISRNVYIAQAFPKQKVKVVVDTQLSTAVEGVDFDFSSQTFEFRGKNTLQLPFAVDIHAAKGKRIVLLLEYGYYEQCPLEGRMGNRLTIDIE